jgi:hypothetical protein
MANDEASVPIRYSDESQSSAAIQRVAAEVAKILTPHEEILYIARQNRLALSAAPDSAVATNNRLILYDAQVLGRISFSDFQWQDVRNVTINQGMLSTELVVNSTDGRETRLGELDKEQAKRLYGICQQMEQEWREKRRVRTMEEERARAGGVQISAPAAAQEDPVERLARAKRMLEQGLISEIEYDAVKAQILRAME